MRIPSKKECYQLIHEMKMMDHIVTHSLMVCQVATFLVDRMKVPGSGLSHEMVQASALLHDITKTRSFKTKENHAQTGEQLLADMGYPEVGRIVGQHVRLDTYFGTETPTEAEIINYADKRVLHDKIVSLRDRMTYILEKYVRTPEHRKKFCKLWRETEKLEARLFACLPVVPEDLNQLIRSEDCAADLRAYRKISSQN
ncbi:MAG: HDIG domain-containing protein [Deltaproteobacteria bacterium]|nr:HDIG domain-containing protein [Deltaproteobacteria bacterium]MBW2193239.1 HDIG domain-containing protein [Deltaproteobacteria bacterium]